MKIEYADLVYLNRELKKRGTRYHIAYKNEDTACLEPPGECCLTEKREEDAWDCIREYYRRKHAAVRFSGDGLYFSLEEEREAGERSDGLVGL